MPLDAYMYTGLRSPFGRHAGALSRVRPDDMLADVIAKVLKKAGEPLHRDEIVKRVLKSRHVKETTILLNLQGKPQFKRVAKATYTLAD